MPLFRHKGIPSQPSTPLPSGDYRRPGEVTGDMRQQLSLSRMKQNDRRNQQLKNSRETMAQQKSSADQAAITQSVKGFQTASRLRDKGAAKAATKMAFGQYKQAKKNAGE